MRQAPGRLARHPILHARFPRPTGALALVNNPTPDKVPDCRHPLALRQPATLKKRTPKPARASLHRLRARGRKGTGKEKWLLSLDLTVKAEREPRPPRSKCLGTRLTLQRNHVGAPLITGDLYNSACNQSVPLFRFQNAYFV